MGLPIGALAIHGKQANFCARTVWREWRTSQGVFQAREGEERSFPAFTIQDSNKPCLRVLTADQSLSHEHQPRVLMKLRHRTAVELNNFTPKYVPEELRPEAKQGSVLGCSQ